MSVLVGFRKILATSALLVMGAGPTPAFGAAIFTTAVEVDRTTLGIFTIDGYEKSSTATSFGVSITGGFNQSQGYALPTGYEYRWIQTVSSSIPAYGWQKPDEVYVDRSRDQDAQGNFTLARSNTPFYADGGVVSGSPYALQFADNPSRELGPDEFHGTWSLSLVAVQPPQHRDDGFNQPEANVSRAIYQLATFAWGFDALKQTDGTMRIDLRDIKQVRPIPSALAHVFDDDPDEATFGDGAWDIRVGLPGSSPAVIPEPSSYLLALSALIAAGVPVYRSRRRSA